MLMKKLLYASPVFLLLIVLHHTSLSIDRVEEIKKNISNSTKTIEQATQKSAHEITSSSPVEIGTALATGAFTNIKAGTESSFLSLFNPAQKEKLIKESIKKNPHGKDTAKIRIGQSIGQDEKNYIKHRSNTNLTALQQFLGDTTITQETAPRIALCLSGGGSRAMIASYGLAQGAENIGLLDCISYISALSGSTWFLAPWTCGTLSLNERFTKLKPIITEGIRPLSDQELTSFYNQCFVKRLFNQQVSPFDGSGASIANTMLFDFGNESMRIRFSEQTIDPLKKPFPLLTAACQDGNLTNRIDGYDWFEITPYEIGSINKNIFVPTWAFGRLYADGKSQDFAPEQTLGLFMAVCSSSLAFSLIDLIAQKNQKMASTIDYISNIFNTTGSIIGSTIGKNISGSSGSNIGSNIGSEIPQAVTGKLAETRPVQPAQFNNFIEHQIKPIELVDAGLAFNIPLPPLLRSERNIDMIIVLDASADIGLDFKLALEWAQTKKSYTYKKIDSSNQRMSIYKSTSPKAPVIIYMPLLNNPNYPNNKKPFDVLQCISSGYCSSFNLKYKTSESDTLAGLTHFTIQEPNNIETIKKVLLDVITEKKTKT